MTEKDKKTIEHHLRKAIAFNSAVSLIAENINIAPGTPELKAVSREVDSHLYDIGVVLGIYEE